MNDQQQQIGEMEKLIESLKEQVAELTSQLQFLESGSVDKHKLTIAENKLRDFESKLDLEISARKRQEVKKIGKKINKN